MSEVSAEVIPNEYIVVFKQHIPEESRQAHYEWTQATHTEAAALRAESDGPELTGVGEQFNIDSFAGYLASIDENLKNEIESKEEVDYVEPNHVVYGSVTQRPVPSWGLARMSSNRRLPIPLPGDLGYTYDPTAGEGTWGYVIDSGILINHVDFGGRARWGANFITGSPNTDEFGHGTHVAGTVGGAKYGMAKKCNLIAVKVLDSKNQGSMAGIIRGVEWAVNDARNNGRIKKSVANMSLGGGYTQATNNAVAAAVRAGLTVIVAAGNDNKDARYYSPASEPLAYTVGSTDPTDTKSDFSNWGNSLDIFGPGRNITSTWNRPGNNAINTISGTSMATPHITGLALTLIARDPARYSTPYAITSTISALANRNTRVLPPLPAGTTSLLAYNGA